MVLTNSTYNHTELPFHSKRSQIPLLSLQLLACSVAPLRAPKQTQISLPLL